MMASLNKPDVMGSQFDQSVIMSALEYANLAVKSEMSGDVQAAITGYEDCVQKFREQIGKAPADKKQIFQMYLSMYDSKLQQLKSKLEQQRLTLAIQNGQIEQEFEVVQASDVSTAADENFDFYDKELCFDEAVLSAHVATQDQS